MDPVQQCAPAAGAASTVTEFQKERPSATFEECSLRVYRSLSELEELRAAWTEWSRHPNTDIDFYAFLCGIKQSTAHPLALAVLRDNVPIALMIGFAESAEQEVRLGYLRLAKLKVTRLAFGDVMGEANQAVAQVLVREVVRLLKDGGYDLAEIGHLSVESDLYRAARKLPNFWMKGHFAEPAPHWRMKMPGSMKEFMAKRSKKHRYWLNRIARVLEKDFPGQVKIEAFRLPDELTRFAKDAEEVAQTSYQRQLGAGFVNNQEFQKRLELTARRDWFRGYILYIEGKPKAFWAGTLYKDVFFLAWTGYDPGFRKYELGTILFLRLIEDLVAQGAVEIDFGFGTALYKERFGDRGWDEDVAHIFAPTVRGVILNAFTSFNSRSSRALKGLLRKLDLENWLKRWWRRKLTEQGAS